MAVSSMRGLSVFISDIRNCANKELERMRVDKELANIRTHFKADRALTAYEKKKYVWKLLYIYMLGYEVEFGMMEATSLISANKYAEKQVGYIVTSVLLNENHEFLRLVINTVRNDIISRNDTFQCLALTMVGNVGGKEFSDALGLDVQKILISSSSRPLVKKKAALCLLRLFRKNPDIINHDTWPERMVALLEERDLGVLLCVMSLLVALVAANPDAYLVCVSKCVRVLERLVRVVDIPQDYTYYAIPSPWLQVKTMRVLQYFPSIDDPLCRKSLEDVLRQILQRTETVKNVNKNNAAHAILFEALALAMHMDASKDILEHCVGLLGRFIGVREPNIRYLGLENMARMLLVADVQPVIRTHQTQIVGSLKDPDISIRRRALDLLYGMCDVDNSRLIVDELLNFMLNAEYAIREELTLKTAVLAERFATDLQWYVDVVLTLIESAGDFVSDEVWFRVVHFVTNNEYLQAYAAARVLKKVRNPVANETMVKVSGYILGEFGHLLATTNSETRATPSEIFAVLHEKFYTVSVGTKCLLLSAYVKILLRAPANDAALHAAVLAVFTKHESFIDAEVQQRAVEYAALVQKGAAMADIMAEMPKFPERESSLLKKAEDTEGDAAEISAVKMRQQHNQSNAIIPAAAVAPPPSLPKEPVPGGLAPPAAPSAAARPPAAAPTSAPAAPPTSTAGPPATASPAAAPAAAPAPAVGDLLGELLMLEAPPPPAGAPQQPAAAGGGLDAVSGALALLDMGGGAPPAAAPPAAAAGAAAAVLVDSNPMALVVADGSGSGAAASVVQPLGSVTEWFKGLMVKDSGVLYEDPNVQIGVKTEWKGAQGRVVLFFGNKMVTPLSNCQLSVGAAAGLRVVPANMPTMVPPRAQIQVPIEAAAVTAPREVPLLSFTYTAVGGLIVPLKIFLPVVLTKFLQPSSLPAADFFSHWKSLSAPPMKLQQVLTGIKPMPLPTMAQLLTSLRIAVLPNMDPNPNNLVACSTLFTETLPAVLVLTRIETDPADRTQLRLTVASPEPSATLAVKEFIQHNIAQVGPPWLHQAAPAAPPPQQQPPMQQPPPPQHQPGLPSGMPQGNPYGATMGNPYPPMGQQQQQHYLQPAQQQYPQAPMGGMQPSMTMMPQGGMGGTPPSMYGAPPPSGQPYGGPGGGGGLI